MISSKIIQAINEAEKYPYIVRVGIFGSHARRDETALSDVDVIIDYDNSSDEFLDNLDDFMTDFENIITTKVDYVTMRGIMKSKDADFREEVLREVKWVYEASNLKRH